MNIKREYYPINFKVGASSSILLWYSADGRVEDCFEVIKSGRLLVGRTSQDMTRMLAKRPNVLIRWDEVKIFDVDEFFLKIKAIRPGTVIDPGTADYFLSGWNLMGDLAFTLKFPKRLLPISGEGALWSLYNKLFLNIVPVAGLSEKAAKGAKWRSDEVAAFSKSIRRAWKFIVRAAPELAAMNSRGR